MKITNKITELWLMNTNRDVKLLKFIFSLYLVGFCDALQFVKRGNQFFILMQASLIIDTVCDCYS